MGEVVWQKAEGRGQKVYYWYVVVSAVESVLTFMATAILIQARSASKSRSPSVPKERLANAIAFSTVQPAES